MRRRRNPLGFKRRARRARRRLHSIRNSPASHVCLGTIALGTGAFDEAVQELQRAVDREPTNDEANLGLARARRERARRARPKRPSQRAIALRPSYWATHVWLGTFYRAQGSVRRGRASSTSCALALTPENARAHYVLCGIYGTGSIGQSEDADRRVPDNRRGSNRVSARIRTGAQRLRISGGSDEAIEKFSEARRVEPRTNRSTAAWRAPTLSGKRLRR